MHPPLRGRDTLSGMRQTNSVLAVLLLALLTLACAARPTPRWSPTSGEALPRQVDLVLRGKAQEHSLSCESRSACDLLAYYGIALQEDAFRLGLPASDNPDLGFVGDVDGPGGRLPPQGYGVHAEPVAARLRAIGLPARAHRGVDLPWLKERLAEGKPVIAWATSSLDAPSSVRMRDGVGRAFVVVPGEHTFLVAGYAPGVVILVDPATGTNKRVPDRRFDASWATLDRQVVVPDSPPAK